MTINDMREFLRNEVKHVQITPEMGDGHIEAMYKLYTAIMRLKPESKMRKSLVDVFTSIEKGNHDVQYTIDDLKAQANRGSFADWDYMGLPADELYSD
ncbi:MAG: hypothetical protein AAF126_01915 [Chloroflexota bacterium]